MLRVTHFLEEWTWAFTELLFQLFTLQWCSQTVHSTTEWEAVFRWHYVRVPREERKYYSCVNSTTATQRWVQPEARLKNSTLSSHASKPLHSSQGAAVWWDRLPLNSPGQRKFSSVAQSCRTLCDPMNRSTPGLPVHHYLPEFTQTHVHRVSDAIQPSHPLLSPSPPAPNPSQHQSLFQ